MKPNLQIRATQTQTMTPQLLQSIRLLQLSALELEQELREALEQNVMLETVEPGEDEDDETPPAQDAVADQDPDEVSGQDPAATVQVDTEFDWSSRESWSGGEPREDDDEPWEARVATPEVRDARLAALEQLQLVIDTPREARLVAVILDAIDDNGYLAQPLDGIAMESALDPRPDAAEVEAALAKVQGVEPAGFGARDLRECLLLQLRALPETPARRLAEAIVAGHLEALANRDFAALRVALGADNAALRPAINLILSLNPKPGTAQAAPADSAMPDVLVSGTPGAWRIVLNADRLPRVRVNRQYERCLHGSGHRMLREQLQEARWLVRGIEMRNDTLLRTARAIFERQSDFLDRGEEGMVPLTLREIADAIGMHESTVCRVTTNKWVQTPWGVYELKAFFPSQITGVEGETSGTAVKAMIRRIVDAENASTPLCDGDIAAILARNGVRVARRTIAKYREAMRIPPAKERGTTSVRNHLRRVSR